MVISPSLLLSSLNLSIITILFVSIFFFSKSYLFSAENTCSSITNTIGGTLHNSPLNKTVSYSSGPFAVNVLKLLATLSVISLILALFLDFQSINITLSLWLNNTPTNISLNFIYDQYFLVFLSVALVVTWSIMEFSYYYMAEDANSTAFFRLLTIFLLNMLILTCSNSLFLIFLGWEGVGFLSFLLISWWTTRNDASSSALEAVIYNRIGDIGLLAFMAISALLFNSWNITEIISFSVPHPDFLPFLLFGLVLAAAGKSAQFGLHPWLPAAMEGPTPVSALLHSSTMVVAGVFLLIRTSELFLPSPSAQTAVLLLGGTTALFAASTAIAQHDIKKIIAYSTTSQLGLMVTAIGIGQPLLAFFHICTHAFFKAMLFLCSGSVIHSLEDEQDLRKMGGLSSLLPVTSACLALGSLALMGTPFLAGFYSKDLILEAAGASTLNTLGLTLGLIATLLTAAYSFRIIFFCFSLNPSLAPLSPIGEENPNLGNALLRLSGGTIISGWFFANFIFVTPSFNVPLAIKGLPLIVTVIGLTVLFVALYFLVTSLGNGNTHTTLVSQWFFVDLLHSLFTSFLFLISLFLSTRTLDRGWSEEIGPQGITKASATISKVNQLSQSGLIKRYLSSSILSLTTIVLLGVLITS
uniref:NADH-ubiquinone oxidoreductase chain 5 n=1 Tax=Glyptocidaris crenularis TaxID=31907 RepID=A0A1L3MYE9_9ECHN|nr:NADH dehydrogenase subunit 5 [Glyptocidaris crenularis]APH07352.1 NADH dehydrogenase subunit 5 [Glyptocidaris crenularis]